MGIEANVTSPSLSTQSIISLSDFEQSDVNLSSTAMPAMSERERIRMEFYQTYDVMTGIRIAATLGGFFGLMVLLVLYKSKCKSQPDEDLEAAISAAVVAEEEEMEAAFNDGPLLTYSPTARTSIGNMSAPVYTRFSSVGGGYSSLMNPSRKRYQFGARSGRVSLPTSEISFRHLSRTPTPKSDQIIRSRIYHRSYNEEDENELEEELEEPYIDRSRERFSHTQSSAAQLSSLTETDLHLPYLEVDEMIDGESTDYLGRSTTNIRNFHKPIDIQVIQPTPQVSPCGSSSGLSESQTCPRHLLRSRCAELEVAHEKTKLAPLASIGSCSAVSSESEMRSVGSDSVFTRTGNTDTDDEETDKDACCSSSLKSDKEPCSVKSEPPNCTKKKKYRIVQMPDSTETSREREPRRSSAPRRYSDSSVQMRPCEQGPSITSSGLRLFPIFKKLSSSVLYETHIAKNANGTDADTLLKTISSKSKNIDSSQSSSDCSNVSRKRTSNASIDTSNRSNSSSASNYYSSVSTLSNITRKYSLTRIAVIEEPSATGPDKKQIGAADSKIACSQSCDQLSQSESSSSPNLKTFSLNCLNKTTSWPTETLF